MQQPSHPYALKKISQLKTLIAIEHPDHPMKELGRLLVHAATDWDTFNQTELSEFIKELKQHFSTPLTKDKIRTKPLENFWRAEAGSSIVQLLELAESVYQQTNFDAVINRILSHYEHLLQQIDFIAELKYHTTEEGGRSTPVFNTGYRPQIKFDFADMQTSGQQTFIDKDTVYPGEEVEAAIRILAVDYFENQLSVGMSFEFREGSRIIGTGKITDIFNQRLIK